MTESDFNLEREIDAYTKNLCRSIRQKRRRAEVAREYREHIEDEIYRLSLNSVSDEAAFRKVCENLGDVPNLRQMLGAVHNRVPPGFFKRLIMLALRLLGAYLLYIVLYAFIVPEGLSYPWYLYIPPLFIVFGNEPYRYIRALFSRCRFVLRLKRLCKKHGYTYKGISTPLLSVFAPSEMPEIIVATEERTYCLKFLTCRRRRSNLHFTDEATYLICVQHSGGVRFVDRRPGNFNLIKSPDLSFRSETVHSFSFTLPPELNDNSRFERVLIINPCPSEITYAEGSRTECAGNGSIVYNMRVFNAKGFIEHLKNIQ